MKGILEFNLDEYEDKEMFYLANKSGNMKSAIDDVWNKCFRPAFKHGYNDKDLQNLLDRLGDDGYDLIDKISQIYNKVLEENGVRFD